MLLATVNPNSLLADVASVVAILGGIYAGFRWLKTAIEKYIDKLLLAHMNEISQNREQIKVLQTRLHNLEREFYHHEEWHEVKPLIDQAKRSKEPGPSGDNSG